MHNRITPKNSIILLGIMITLSLIVFFDPFDWLVPPGYLRPKITQEDARRYSEYIQTNAVPGETYLVQQVREFPLVFLSELGGLAEEPAFLANTLPELVHQGGLDTLAVYFLLARDQEKIDRLMSQQSFDTTLANTLLFNRSVLWGYREYRDILEAAWEINHNEPGRLKVLGLNLLQDFSQLTSEADFRNPDKLRTIMDSGIPDTTMAQTLVEFLQNNPGNRTLAYILREQGFPRIGLPLFTEQLSALGYPEVNQFARQVHLAGFTNHKALGFHSPWPSNQTRNRSEYPASGTIEPGLDSWDRRNTIDSYPIGFSFGGPFRDVIILRSVFNYSFPDTNPGALKLSDLFDGTIVLGRIRNLTPATIIPDFITEENLDLAIQNFPGPRPGDTSVDDFLRFIQDIAENRAKISHELD